MHSNEYRFAEEKFNKRLQSKTTAKSITCRKIVIFGANK